MGNSPFKRRKHEDAQVDGGGVSGYVFCSNIYVSPCRVNYGRTRTPRLQGHNSASPRGRYVSPTNHAGNGRPAYKKYANGRGGRQKTGQRGPSDGSYNRRLFYRRACFYGVCAQLHCAQTPRKRPRDAIKFCNN